MLKPTLQARDTSKVKHKGPESLPSAAVSRLAPSSMHKAAELSKPLSLDVIAAMRGTPAFEAATHSLDVAWQGPRTSPVVTGSQADDTTLADPEDTDKLKEGLKVEAGTGEGTAFPAHTSAADKEPPGAFPLLVAASSSRKQRDSQKSRLSQLASLPQLPNGISRSFLTRVLKLVYFLFIFHFRCLVGLHSNSAPPVIHWLSL